MQAADSVVDERGDVFCCPNCPKEQENTLGSSSYILPPLRYAFTGIYQWSLLRV
ncbi:hypothetical protein BX600DRAFT_455049 [Xylariales sp. PMI_506]|nr:hypothetical protein BX600DRAFT_455049 [Xylariales sp. PMI_506]